MKIKGAELEVTAEENGTVQVRIPGIWKIQVCPEDAMAMAEAMIDAARHVKRRQKLKDPPGQLKMFEGGKNEPA